MLGCEAALPATEAAPAIRTGYPTAHAREEIAVAARGAAWIPFHFSRRYSNEPAPVHTETWTVCPAWGEPRVLSAPAGLSPP